MSMAFRLSLANSEFPEVSCISPSCYAARRGSHRVSSLFNEALARCFHTSASQGVERDAIHATRAGILGSSGIRPLWSRWRIAMLSDSTCAAQLRRVTLAEQLVAVKGSD